jgi:hypothetical protein
MKNLGKNLFPELHFNSISRDLLLVTGMGLLVAMAIVTFGVMVFSQF